MKFHLKLTLACRGSRDLTPHFVSTVVHVFLRDLFHENRKIYSFRKNLCPKVIIKGPRII
jgi:hypothetical protein